MGTSALANRLSRLRLRQDELAARTKLHANTVKRALSDEQRILKSTERRIMAAIEAEELALRDYLMGLHPPADQATGDAA